MISAPISIGSNYRFTVADDRLLAEILTHHFKGGLYMYRQFLAQLRSGGVLIGRAVHHALARYKGDLARDLTIVEAHNIVPTVLRYELASLISGTTITPTLKANYFALGSGSNAPANTDTTLQTETARAVFTNRYSSLNVAYLDIFLGTNVVAGNSYNEAGIFVDGASGANTGYLLSRVAVSLSLGASSTLTVNSTITIS